MPLIMNYEQLQMLEQVNRFLDSNIIFLKETKKKLDRALVMGVQSTVIFPRSPRCSARSKLEYWLAQPPLAS
jgi:hypothetical protein